MQYACAILYSHLWFFWLYHILPHYVINGMKVGGGGVLVHKTCVCFFSTILSKKFLTLRRIQHDMVINVYKQVCV